MLNRGNLDEGECPRNVELRKVESLVVGQARKAITMHSVQAFNKSEPFVALDAQQREP